VAFAEYFLVQDLPLQDIDVPRLVYHRQETKKSHPTTHHP
jgi:hypothetical protein